jgi:hypothetical protein
MSPKLDDETPLDDGTLSALRAADDLIPTSVTEVERAEASLSDLPLPEGLRSYRAPTGGQVMTLASKPRFAGYAAAAACGALAAAAALFWLRPVPAPPVTSAGGELVR